MLVTSHVVNTGQSYHPEPGVTKYRLSTNGTGPVDVTMLEPTIGLIRQAQEMFTNDVETLGSVGRLVTSCPDDLPDDDLILPVLRTVVKDFFSLAAGGRLLPLKDSETLEESPNN